MCEIIAGRRAGKHILSIFVEIILLRFLILLELSLKCENDPLKLKQMYFKFPSVINNSEIIISDQMEAKATPPTFLFPHTKNTSETQNTLHPDPSACHLFVCLCVVCMWLVRACIFARPSGLSVINGRKLMQFVPLVPRPERLLQGGTALNGRARRREVKMEPEERKKMETRM